MIVKLRTQGLQTFDQVRAFLAGSQPLDLEIRDQQQAYDFIADTLRFFRYHQQGRAEKGLLRRYLIKVTGLSRAQVTRLIARQRGGKPLRDRRGAPARPFRRRYTDQDIRLLAELDALHDTLSGAATRKLCERAYHLFGDARFERLASISHGQIYNLRHSALYQRKRRTFEKTRPTPVGIAERRPPRPHGRPGFVRVDTVHQGDLDGTKGLYHINLVDEVTQFQFVGSVARIGERHLVPLLESLIQAFPFVIRGFHADNGSEYINKRVAGMLQKLNVTEFTKSRSRQTNDNALVESKNGSILRKHLGYAHISARHAQAVNAFTQGVLSPYLNYHRPCHFPTEVVDDKGRRRKRYRYADMMTPYEKLRSLPELTACLKDGITLEALDAQAHEISDTEAARRLKAAREKMFHAIHTTRASAA
jgi:hypothetical protein